MNEPRHVACYGGWGDLAVRIDNAYGPEARIDFLAAMTTTLMRAREAEADLAVDLRCRPDVRAAMLADVRAEIDATADPDRRDALARQRDWLERIVP